MESAGNAQVVSPLTFLEASTPGTGGFIETPQQRLQVRHLIEKIADPDALGGVPVAGTGGRLRISDVADVTVDHQPLIGDAVVEGGPGLMLVIEKFPGADTRRVSEGVYGCPRDAATRTDRHADGHRDLQPCRLPRRSLGQPRSRAAHRRRADAAGAGGMPVAVAIAHRRAGCRAAVLLVAALVLDLLGQGFNAIMFAGLAAAIAVVVDEAVVATDRVTQALRQHPAGAERTRTSVIVAASAEVRRPLTYATLIVLLAIAPRGGHGGAAGSVLRAGRHRVRRRGAGRRRRRAHGHPGVDLVPDGAVATEAGRTSQAFPVRGLGTSRRSSASAGTVSRAGGLGGGVRSDRARGPAVHGDVAGAGVRGRRRTCRTVWQAGHLERADDLAATELSDTLTALPGVAGVGAHVGRAITGDRLANVNSASVWVRIDDEADHEETFEAIAEVVRDVPDVESEVVTYTAKRIRDVGALTTGDNAVRGAGLDVLTGADQPLVVRVYGEDLAVLRTQAEQVLAVMSDVDGVIDARGEVPDMEPTIEIEVDLEKAQALGLTPGHVRRTEATLLHGIQVGSVFEEQKVFDVIVRGTPATRSGVEGVRRMLIDTPSGGHVRLDQVADVRVVPSPSVIDREAVSRYVDIQAGVEGRSVSSCCRGHRGPAFEGALPDRVPRRGADRRHR